MATLYTGVPSLAGGEKEYRNEGRLTLFLVEVLIGRHLESNSSIFFGKESGESQSVSQRNMLDRERLGGDIRTRKSKENRQCCLEVRGWTLPKVGQALRRGDWE